MRPLLLFSTLLICCATVRAQWWNNPGSGMFATSLTRGGDGLWWAGSDNEGLYRRDASGNWAPFAGATELGTNDVTCVRVDAANRVWVGTANSGLSVYNGKWTRFSSLDGPLSGRVNDIEIDRKGDVWGATDAGVFRWNSAKGWAFPGTFSPDAATRTLARQPVFALAFDRQNRVLMATSLGLSRLRFLPNGTAKIEFIGRPALQQPPSSSGEGFLPAPVHDVAVDNRGAIWCATRWGVCLSRDDGAKWQFLRGADWLQNAKGSAVPLKIDEKAAPVDLLAEDWVTTLAPTKSGKMWLGFRSKGAEERDCRSLETIVSTEDDPKGAVWAVFNGNWTSAIVPLDADTAAFARYGGAMGSLFGVDLPLPKAGTALTPAPAPGNAKFSPGQLAQMAKNLDSAPEISVGSGQFYALDRRTRGDWPLRYGNEGLELLGMGGRNYKTEPFHLDVETGPNPGKMDDAVYSYTHENHSPNPNALQVPLEHQRRQSEVNDGTWQSQYPLSLDGPGLWTTFSVPAGLHRVAFYWFNVDGLQANSRWRDHRVELFAGALSREQCLQQKPLASTRLWSGWNGEYASFAVRGPAKFQVRVARDRSVATKLSGVFFDRLGQMPKRPTFVPAYLKMPVAPQADETAPYFQLWQACDRAESRGVPAPLERLAAIRAAKSAGAPADLLRAWRVQAGLWDEETNDRKEVALPATAAKAADDD